MGISTRAPCPRSPPAPRCGTRMEEWSWLDAGWCRQDLGVSWVRGIGQALTHVFTCTHEHRCARTHTLTGTSHPAPFQPARPALCHARMCQGGRWGGKFGGKQRDTRKEGRTGPTNDSQGLHPEQQAAVTAPVAAAAPRENGGSRGNTARGRAASAVPATLIKSEPGQRRSN